jgi:hypothetical protein
MSRSLGSKVGDAIVVHLRGQTEYVLSRRTSAVEKNHGRGCLVEGRTQPADRFIAMGIIHQIVPFYLRACSSIGGSMRSTRARCRSSHLGNLSASPRDSMGSSSANPGGSVAISNKTPPGSRK